MTNRIQSLKLHDDRPDASSADLYHRRKFVERLTQAVARRVESSPFIIGIEGTWGEGKSTVLEYMAQELRTYHKDVVLVRFNPWAYPSQELMLVGLVQVVSEELRESPQKRVKDLAKDVLGFVGGAAELLGSVTGQGYLEKGGAAGKTLADMLGKEDSFQKQKAELEAKLKKVQVQIVVLVDDLDRLDHEAIRSVFRLLKAVFDLPSFTYILAYDPEIIASALESHFESRGAMSGRRYLEKIIQLPLALPKLDPIDLEEDLYDNLVEAFKENDLPLSTDEHLAVRQLARVLSTHITTPREIRRLGNAVRFALPILREETNPVDVCRIEALRVLFPDVFEQVLLRPDLLTDAGILTCIFMRNYRGRTDVQALFGEPPPSEPRGELYELFKDVPKAALRLLGLTFPNVAAEFEVREPVQYFGAFAAHQPEYLKRYLQYAIGSDDVEDAAVRTFIRDTVSAQARAEATLASVEEKRLSRFLNKIKQYGRDLGDEEHLGLTKFLAVYLYTQHRPDTLDSMPFLEMRSTVIDLLEAGAGRASEEVRWVTMQRVLASLPEWWMPLDLFDASASLFARRVHADRGESNGALRKWLDSVLFKHQADLMTEARAKVLQALVLLAEHHGRDLTQSLVLDFIGDDSKRARDWLLLLARQVRGSVDLMPHQFSIEQYMFLNQAINMEVLLEHLEALVPPVQGLRDDDEAIARIMLERLREIQPDAKEIMGRQAAVQGKQGGI